MEHWTLFENMKDTRLLVERAGTGIDDAMKKGIELATGEWINFMNAGDSFYSPDVIASIFADREEKADVVYGDHHVV